MAMDSDRLPSPRRIERLFVRDIKPEFYELISIFDYYDSMPRFNLIRLERLERCELCTSETLWSAKEC